MLIDESGLMNHKAEDGKALTNGNQVTQSSFARTFGLPTASMATMPWVASKNHYRQVRGSRGRLSAGERELCDPEQVKPNCCPTAFPASSCT